MKLLEPVSLGPYRIPNRIVMSAMTRNRAPHNVPGALNAEYYAQRASAGLIVTESTAISPTALGWPDTPGIYSGSQVEGWRMVTDAVHASGGRIYLQLWHCGPISHPRTQPDGATPIGPSAIEIRGTVRTRQGREALVLPREIQLGEIGGVIEEYRSAAANARMAGFDGVEIHAANGFLLDQFLRSSSNRRQDGYGGPPASRCRLLFEVAAAVVEVWGGNRVGVRLSPTNPTGFNLCDDDPALLVRTALEGLNGIGISYVTMVEGSTSDAPATHEIDWEDCRRSFDGLYVANNGFGLASAEHALTGRADLVAFGRPFISNPDLVRRFQSGAPLSPVNIDTIYAADHRGYTDYPQLEAGFAPATSAG